MDTLFSVKESKNVVYVNINTKNKKKYLFEKYQTFMKPNKTNLQGKLCGWVFKIDTSSINKRTKIGREKVKALILKQKDKINKKLKLLEEKLIKNNDISLITQQKKVTNKTKKENEAEVTNTEVDEEDVTNIEVDDEDVTNLEVDDEDVTNNEVDDEDVTNNEVDDEDVTNLEEDEEEVTNIEEDEEMMVYKFCNDVKDNAIKKEQHRTDMTKFYNNIHNSVLNNNSDTKAVYDIEEDEDIEKLFSMCDED